MNHNITEAIETGLSPNPGKGDCPVCKGNLVGKLTYCGVCELPHHPGCWSFNGMCAGFGCGCKETSLVADPYEKIGRSILSAKGNLDALASRTSDEERLKKIYKVWYDSYETKNLSSQAVLTSLEKQLTEKREYYRSRIESACEGNPLFEMVKTNPQTLKGILENNGFHSQGHILLTKLLEGFEFGPQYKRVNLNNDLKRRDINGSTSLLGILSGAIMLSYANPVCAVVSGVIGYVSLIRGLIYSGEVKGDYDIITSLQHKLSAIYPPSSLSPHIRN